MPSAPASRGPGPDEDPGLDEDEPLGPDEEYDDPEHPAMPWDVDVAAIWAETGQLAAEDAADAEYLARRGLLGGLAAGEAGTRGRRGPGAARVGGTCAGGVRPARRAGSVRGSAWMWLRAGRGCWGSPSRSPATRAARGATDDEVIGLICALDRAEASACSLKHAAVAELIRRRPAPGGTLTGTARMPQAWGEFTADELRWALAETRGEADAMLDLAHALEVKLPGTRARSGPGCCATRRSRSSPGPPRSWIRVRRGRRRRWCWGGRGG